jgi:hypothetical protein
VPPFENGVFFLNKHIMTLNNGFCKRIGKVYLTFLSEKAKPEKRARENNRDLLCGGLFPGLWSGDPVGKQGLLRPGKTPVSQGQRRKRRS